MTVYILDTSAFVAGFVPSGEGDFVTAPAVMGELTNPKERMKVEIALEQGAVTLKEADEGAKERVREAAIASGDIGLLTGTDIDVLALALEGMDDDDVIILTDDFDIQNVARHMGIPYKPLAERGIGRVFHWLLICKGCKKRFEEGYKEEECDICGSPLKRVPRKGG